MIVPNHVAIIMDGNGRWATNRGLSRSAGHLEGSKTLEKIAFHALNMGVKYLSVYAFSTDNFKRSKEEVDYLMNLVVKYFKTKADKYHKKGIRILISGRKNNLSDIVLDSITKIEKLTENNTNGRNN